MPAPSIIAVRESGALVLPIAARELAVATRKRSTFWIRVVAAAAAVVVGTGCLLLEALAGTNPFRLGSILFNVLTGLSFAAALLAGPLFTSDAISEEKREGTLGFLFLTDLRGYDVVAGKLVATSMRVLYAILSLIPVLGISLLLGGVSGGQFWRTILAILLALLCSLLTGLTVSSASQHATRAIGRTVGLLLIWGFGPLIAGAALQSWDPSSWTEWVLCFSPVYPFGAASTGRNYWASFGIVTGICCLLFYLASYWTAHRWQDSNKVARQHKVSGLASSTVTNTNGPLPVAKHRELLDSNPVMWLSSREGWRSRNASLAIAALLLCCVLTLAFFDRQAVATIWGGLFGLVSLLLYLWSASRSSRLLSEMRKSGLLELLLATPLTAKQIVMGQWNGLVKMYWLPLLLLAIAHFVGTSFSIRLSISALAQNPVDTVLSIGSMVLTSLLTCAALIANLAALAWFGAYCGLTSKTAGAAMLKTLVFVQLLPWFVISFLALAVMMPLIRAGGAPIVSANVTGIFVISAVPPVLILIKDVIFIRWSRSKLLNDFRNLAVPQNRNTALLAVAALAPIDPSGVPPIIPPGR